MRLDPFIADLLYDHDCVIIPDFGGIVTNYRAARLNVVSHVIHPPSKHIGFNVQLKQNDGLLVNYVASVLSVSYKDASSMVAQCIAEYRKELQQHGRFSLERIGVFFNDRAGRLQFIPDEGENYLTASFGCKPVQLKPVVISATDKTDDTPVIDIQAAKRKWSPLKVAAAIAVPALLVGSFLAGNRASQHGELGFHSLNPFAEPRKETVYAPAIESWDLQLELTKPDYSALLVNEEETTIDFVSGAKSEEGVALAPKTKTAPAVSTRVAERKVSSTKKKASFALIGGAFQVKENAERLVNQLKAQGYDASLAGMKDNLHLVAYGHYDVRSEAVEDLRRVQSSGGKAWIKSNP
ncbi:MAG: SPOR domain-containing protein [Flavobacteriales bacterium]|jgi:nucleoid DNA-binding protein